MALAVSVTYERSGVRDSLRGVGTQMMIASVSSSRMNRSVASKPPPLHLADDLGADVADVALAALELDDLGGVDVEAEHCDPAVGEGPGERQAHVPQADDTDADVAGGDPGFQDRPMIVTPARRVCRLVAHAHRLASRSRRGPG